MVLFKNRRSNPKYNSGTLIFVVILAMVALVGGFFFWYKGGIRNSVSRIHRVMEERARYGHLPELATEYFDEGSAEDAFIEGVALYEASDFEGAYNQFNESLALMSPQSDIGLSAYVYMYLNLYLLQNEEYGNLEYVTGFVNGAIKYLPIAENHEDIWYALSSVAYDKDSDAKVIELLESLLEYEDRLSQEAGMAYTNHIGTLQFFDRNYGESIRHFYDGLGMANGMEYKDMPEGVSDEFSYASSYIANFYYIFEDYEHAAELLKRNLSLEIEDPKKNAMNKYSDYINLSSVYLEMGNTEEAIKVCDQMDELIIPYLDEDIEYDVIASVYDSRAWAAIQKGEYEAADEYIKKAYELEKLAEEYAYYSDVDFIDLTYARLLIAKENYQDAKQILEKLRDNVSSIYRDADTDVYDLLSIVYEKLGDTQGHIKNQDEIRAYEQENSRIIQKEYLEFAQNYAESEYLLERNVALRKVIKLGWIVVYLVIFSLVCMIIALVYIRRSSRTDELTTLSNRRVLQELLNKYSGTGVKKGSAVFMIDVDNFKKYNDIMGHLSGDDCLRDIAKVIKGSVRKKDPIIRYGGEEFMLFFTSISKESYEDMAERIRKRVENLDLIYTDDGNDNIVTISIGIYINHNYGEDLRVMLNKADKALYEAKSTGKNKVVIFEEISG